MNSNFEFILRVVMIRFESSRPNRPNLMPTTTSWVVNLLIIYLSLYKYTSLLLSETTTACRPFDFISMPTIVTMSAGISRRHSFLPLVVQQAMLRSIEAIIMCLPERSSPTICEVSFTDVLGALKPLRYQENLKT